MPTRVEAAGAGDARRRELALLKGGGVHRVPPRRARTSFGIRVLLAETVGLVRAGLRSLLERERDIAVAGEATSGEEAVALTTEVRPDVVLMDIRLDGLGGLAATRRILANPDLAKVSVMILTSDESEKDLYGALQSGATGFVLLDAEPAELVRAVRIVAGGGAQLSPWATRRVLEHFAMRPDPPRSYPELFNELTARERQIVALVARGLTNGEIAQRLVLSPATVKTHVSRSMLKLHARDRARLVTLAYQSGFIQHGRAVEATVTRNGSAPPLAAI